MLDNRIVPLGPLGRMKGSHVRVMLALYSFADGAGLCWPSYRSLAERADMCLGAVKRAIAEMASLNYLSIERRQRGDRGAASNRYRIADELLARRRSAPGPQTSPGGLAESPEGETGKASLTKTESEGAPVSIKNVQDDSSARDARPKNLALSREIAKKWLGGLSEFVTACMPDELERFWLAAQRFDEALEKGERPPPHVKAYLNRLDDAKLGSHWWRARQALIAERRRA